MGLDGLSGLFERGGPIVWTIAALSVVALALILWKAVALVRMGAWDRAVAEAVLRGGGAACGVRSTVVAAAQAARADERLSDAEAREETERVARRTLAEARAGLRGLEVIATVAPLLGLLGTVLGMIGAFQALQAAGSRADPSVLAGGIWEALLTTAAGMGVAIPAQVALAWFESVIERAAEDMEDLATRVFLGPVE